MDNADSFARMAPHLTALQLVAIDFPGHAHSEHRGPDAGYLYVNWLPVVADVAHTLGWDRFSLVGHSMGAGVSLLTAAAMPEQVDRLVMIEGIGPMTTPASETAELLQRALASRRKATSRDPRIYPSIDAGIAQLRKFNADVCEEGARLLVERAMRPVEGGFAFRHDTRLRSTSLTRFTDEHVVDCIRAVRCPTLLIRGKNGWTPPERWADRIDAFADLTIVEIEGSHHVHLDSPVEVARAVAEHLLG